MAGGEGLHVSRCSEAVAGELPLFGKISLEWKILSLLVTNLGKWANLGKSGFQIKKKSQIHEFLLQIIRRLTTVTHIKISSYKNIAKTSTAAVIQTIFFLPKNAQ